MSQEPTPIRILCVDDHPIVRQGIAALLAVETDMRLVALAANGHEALQKFREHRPDITLMDLQMPGMGGLQAIAAIRAEFPDARIIVLTTYAGDAQTQQALQAGASGYLLKNALHKELLDAIRAVHAGGGALPSEASHELAELLPDEPLNPAEIRVLRFLAEGNALADVARLLGLSEAQVQSQVQGLLDKLDGAPAGPQAATGPEDTLLQAERAARHAAEAANRAKSQFLVGMSHELRTPLNAVLGYAQLLTMEGGLSARQARGLDTIHQSGQHLLALINDILDLARIEAGRTDLSPTPTELPALLRAAQELMRVKAEEKRLALSLHAAPGLPDAVMVDERRLRQVLLNLLGNAIKFTDTGSVALHASSASLGPAQVLLKLVVEDTGIGMREQDLERIFKPFEQVGELRHRSGGTGLGLAITRALVHDMGGQIQVSSEYGRGSRFLVELPLPVVQAAAAGGPPAAGIARYLGPRRRVLVVDDVAANRALLRDFLSDAGFDVEEAGDGGELMSTARRFRPHLIVLDSVMPAMDGLEAASQLRGDAELGALPVIVVSATTTAEHRAACLQVGASVFLTKPVSLQALHTHIGEQLGLQWAEPAGGPPG